MAKLKFQKKGVRCNRCKRIIWFPHISDSVDPSVETVCDYCKAIRRIWSPFLNDFTPSPPQKNLIRGA